MNPTRQKIRAFLNQISTHPLQELSEEARAYRQSGWEAFLGGNYEDARHCYTKAIGKGHAHPDLQLMLGHLCYQSNDLSGAHEWYGKARLLAAVSDSISAEETNPLFPLCVGNTHYKQSNYGAAIDEYKAAIACTTAASYEFKVNVLICLSDAYIQRALERADRSDWDSTEQDLTQALENLEEVWHCCSRSAKLVCEKIKREHTQGVIRFYQAAYFYRNKELPENIKREYKIRDKREYKIFTLKAAVKHFNQALALAEEHEKEKIRTKETDVKAPCLNQSEVCSDRAWAYLELSRIERETDTTKASAISKDKESLDKAEESINDAIEHYERVEGDLTKSDPTQGKFIQGELIQGELIKGELIQEERIEGELIQGELIRKYSELSSEHPTANLPDECTPEQLVEVANLFSLQGQIAQEQRILEDNLNPVTDSQSLKVLGEEALDTNAPYGKAIFYYKQAIKRQQKTDQGTLKLDELNRAIGDLYYQTQAYDKAITSYEEAIKIARSEKRPHYVYYRCLGDAYTQLANIHKPQENRNKNKNKNKEKTIKYAKKAEEAFYIARQGKMGLADLDASYNYLGNTYYDIENYLKAIAQYKAAIDTAPKQAVYHGNLANAYKEYVNQPKTTQTASSPTQLDDYRKATIQHYKKAIELADGNATDQAEYHNNLGNVYFSLGNVDSNEESYAAATENYSAAIEQYQAAALLAPKTAIYHHNQANAHRQRAAVEQKDAKAEYDKAQEAYELAIAADSKNSDSYFQLGHLYMDMDKPEKAAHQYNKALEYNPDNPDYHNALGLAYRRSQRIEEAKEEYRRALSQEPEHKSTNRNFGLLLHATGEYSEAISKLEQVLKQQPDDSDVLISLGLSYLELEKENEGIAYLRQVQNDWRASYVLGRYYNQSEQFEQAIEPLQQAQVQAIGEKTSEIEDISAQLETSYQSLAAAHPQDTAYLQKLEKTKINGRIHYYKKVLEKLPTHPQYHVDLGNDYYRRSQQTAERSQSEITQDLEAAAEQWVIALEMPQTTPAIDKALVTNNLGTAYDGLKQFRKARTLYKQAAKLSKDKTFVPYYNLGNANYRLRHFRAALKSFLRAIDIREDTSPDKFPPAYFNAGNCYFQLGQFSEAIESWKTAYQTNPNYLESIYNLGIVYWITGAREQALFIWLDALRVQPDNQAAKANLELVKARQQPNLQIYDPLHQTLDPTSK